MENIDSPDSLPVSGKNVNKLFPVFLKLEQLRVLLIGGGNVALEKLLAMVNNAPLTSINVVTKEVSDAFMLEAQKHVNVRLIIDTYTPGYLDDCDLVIAAVNDLETSRIISNDAKQKGKLINVADKPGLCDFYLGSIVTKGSIKMAISTNGKSPTMAKRLRQVFEDLLPDELEDVLNNMQQIRSKLKGDFAQKVHKLNELTSILLEQEKDD